MQNSEPRLRDVQCITAAGLHRIAYTEWGDPDNPRVLVCVHGLTRVGRDFDPLARVMMDEFRVVCPDVAGRGRSSWLRDPTLYQIPGYVPDMVTLLARIDATSVSWFGTSMGGVMGMALAGQAGNPIERLILNDVGPVITGLSLERIAQYVGQPVRFKSVDEADAYVRAISASFGPHTDAQWRFLTEIVIRKDGDEWVMHYDPAIAIPIRAQVAANTQKVDIMLWSLWDAIQCRTLAVRGELSDLLPFETHLEMGRRGPCAELVTISGVGHAPTFQNPEQIEIAREFLLRKD